VIIGSMRAERARILAMLQVVNSPIAALVPGLLESLILPRTRLEALDASEALIREGNFDGSVFRNCSFDNAHLSKTSLSMAKLTDSSLEGLNCMDSVWSQIEVNGGRGRGASFHRVSLISSRFCDIDLSDCRFTDCYLAHVRMSHVKLKDARFENCHLEHASVSESNLEGCEFVNCVVDTQTQVGGSHFGEFQAGPVS
jgi:hypothetical protein